MQISRNIVTANWDKK